MHQRKLILIAILILCAVTGCKSTGQMMPDKGIAGQTIKRSHHGFENKLLSYVPEDAPFVIASTGQYGLVDSEFQEIWQKIMEFIGHNNKMFNEDFLQVIEEYPDIYKKSIRDAINYAIENNKYYTHPHLYADKFGINKETLEWVFYIDGSVPVFKMTIKDGKKFKTEFLKQQQKARENNEQLIKNINSIPEETKKKFDIKNNDKPILAPIIDGNWIWVNTENNHTNPSSPGDQNNSSSKRPYGIRIDQNMITLVPFIKGTQDFIISDKIKNNQKPSKAYHKEAFTQLLGNQSAFAVGTLNRTGLFDLMQIQECRQEVEQYISREMDNFNVIVSIDKNNDLQIDGSVQFHNSDILNELQALKHKHINILDEKTWLGIDLSISIMGMVNFVKHQAKMLEDKFAQCESIKETMITINEKAGSVSNAMLMLMFMGIDTSIFESIDGVALSIDNINLNRNTTPSDAFLNPEQFRIALVGDGRKYETFLKDISNILEMPDLTTVSVGSDVKRLQRGDMIFYTGLSNQTMIASSDENITNQLVKAEPVDGPLISLAVDSRSITSFTPRALEKRDTEESNQSKDPDIQRRNKAINDYTSRMLKKYYSENYIQGHFDIDTSKSELKFHGKVKLSIRL